MGYLVVQNMFIHPDSQELHMVCKNLQFQSYFSSFTLCLTLLTNYLTYRTLSFPLKLSLVCLQPGFSFLFQLLQPLHDPPILQLPLIANLTLLSVSLQPLVKCFRLPDLFCDIIFPSVCPEFPNFHVLPVLLTFDLFLFYFLLFFFVDILAYVLLFYLFIYLSILLGIFRYYEIFQRFY